MSLLIFRGISVTDDKYITGMLTLKNGNAYINNCEVKHETVGRCTGMFDCNHTMIYEDDLIAHGDLVYRICHNPKDKSLGKLLLFDLVRHTDNVTALKLHKPLIPYDKLVDHIEDFDRDFIRNSELVGDLYSFRERMQTIDVSKVKGDKDAFINKAINEAANND